jgi:hypothetical protein
MGITLDGTHYPHATKAGLYTNLTTGECWLSVTEGAGNHHDQHHIINGEYTHLDSLLRECAQAGIKTETASID